MRTAQLAKALTHQGCEVTIYSLTGRRQDYKQSTAVIDQHLPDGLREIVDLSLPRGMLQAAFRRLGLARVWQYPLLSWRLLPPRLKQLIEEVDWVLCDFPFFSFVDQLLLRKPVYLISHNLEHRLIRQERRWYSRWLANRVARLEAGAPLKYSGILACTEEDRAFFAERNQGSCLITEIPNGVIAKDYAISATEGQALRESLGFGSEALLCLFVGSSYGPNSEAFQWLKSFVKQYRSRLNDMDLHFVVVGSVAKQPYRKPGLVVTSFVDNCLPYYAAADVSFNPIVQGSGSNVKNYEAMATGLPLLSTEFGVRGMNLEGGRDYFHFERDSLMSALSELHARRRELATFGQNVQRRYQDEIFMDRIVYKRLLAQLEK